MSATPDSLKAVFKVANTLKMFRSTNTADGVKASHNILNGFRGGLLYVSEANTAAFNDAYADDIRAGYSHFLSENRTPVFKMFVDLDLVRIRRGEATPDEIISYCQSIHSAVIKFYNGVDTDMFDIVILRAVVKESPSKNTIDAYGELPPTTWKSGVHLIWPNLLVNSAQAITMRETIISCLMFNHGPLEDIQTPWPQIVDQAVYISSGLRMVYSEKCEKCPTCKGVNHGDCDSCEYEYNGHINTHREYRPWTYLCNGVPDDSFIVELAADRRLTIKLSSIRSYAESPNESWFLYEGAPIAPITSEASRQRLVGGGRDFAEDQAALSKMRDKVAIIRSDPMYPALETFIRSHTLAHWSKVFIKNIHTNPSRTFFVVVVDGEGSSYCTNRQASHNSNRIYFHVNKTGISQKCFCRCDTTEKRINGKCMAYASKPWLITDVVRAILWPDGIGLDIGFTMADKKLENRTKALFKILNDLSQDDISDADYGSTVEEESKGVKRKAQTSIITLSQIPPECEVQPSQASKKRKRPT